jgi:multisubunit Na+/H+ antiporter MnhG subunit
MIWCGIYHIPLHPLSPLLLCLGIVRVLVVLVLSLLQLLLLSSLVAHNLSRANQRGDRVKRRVIVVW